MTIRSCSCPPPTSAPNRAPEVPGAYTDDTVVRAIVNNIKRFKKEGREEWFNFTNADLAQLKTWGDLV